MSNHIHIRQNINKQSFDLTLTYESGFSDIINSNVVRCGIAYGFPKDNYCKKLGRDISQGRLDKYKSKTLPIKPILSLSGDTLFYVKKDVKTPYLVYFSRKVDVGDSDYALKLECLNVMNAILLENYSIEVGDGLGPPKEFKNKNLYLCMADENFKTEWTIRSA